MNAGLERKEIKSAWESFIVRQNTGEYKMRDFIQNSWQRCYENGVDFQKRAFEMLDENQMVHILNKNAELIEISRHYLGQLYELLEKSQFLLTLSDKNGIILISFHEKDYFKGQEDTLAVVGRDYSERSAGTNGIGTCIIEDKPMQIYAEEHYNKGCHYYTCSAAPIHDENGILIGTVNITGHYRNVHIHTLALVQSVVETIEEKIKLKKTYQKIEGINSQLKTTIEAINDGILSVSESGEVLNINEKAIEMLKLNPEKKYEIGDLIMNGYNINDLVNNINSKISVEIPFLIDQSEVRIMARLYPIHRTPPGGVVMILYDAKTIKRLVNEMTGSRAKYRFTDIIGESVEIKNTIRLGIKASQSSSTVLLNGESGTGKELFAQSIHNNSNRVDKPFIAINCGALPKGLIESELFGYEGGAFTGAKKEGNPGKFELADGGTIFLDEIGDMPLDIQVMLLRVLQSGEIFRIGGIKPRQVNIRVIAATNVDLEQSVKNKTFREDLYYRINVFKIKIPPLRERRMDISILANYFITKYAQSLSKEIFQIDQNGLALLENYKWPGNIRELENVIERAVNISESGYITSQELDILNNTLSDGLGIDKYDSPVCLLKGDKLRSILERNQYNIRKTAEEMGVSRKTIYDQMTKYDIKRNG